MKINDVDYEIVHTFPVMWSGWECDDVGYVVKETETNELKIALSSHGGFYIAKVKELFEKIHEYINAIKETEKAIEMMEK